MIITQPLDKILFFDIETVGVEKDLETLMETNYALYSVFIRYIDWFHKRFPEDANLSEDEIFKNRAALVPEFAKIICLSAGVLDKHGNLKIKSFHNNSEKDLLVEVRQFLDKIHGLNYMLCGHNIKTFDLPMLSKRMVINNIMPPKILPHYAVKPWDIKVIDTKEVWQFNNNYSLSSLDLVCVSLGIESPKIGDVIGNKVHEEYWNNGNLDSISEYCSKDVESTFNVVQKLINLQ